jgi:hypothetical protein
MTDAEKKEFYEYTDRLMYMVEYGGDLDVACDQCKYCDRCTKECLYFGCGAWEESMGDDL